MREKILPPKKKKKVKGIKSRENDGVIEIRKSRGHEREEKHPRAIQKEKLSPCGT